MADASDASEEEAARAILSVSPLIKDVGFIKGARKGVYARLWCKACHPGRDSEQMNVTLTRTTLSACATELLRLINEKHGTHLAAAEEARAAAALEAAAAAGPSAPTTAFEALAAAQLVSPAVEAANAAEQLAKQARQAKHAAEQVLEAAARRAEDAEKEAAKLEKAADDARQMAGLGRKQARIEDADAEPSWRSWTLSKFNGLFEFGDAGDGSCIEKTFKLAPRKSEEYKGFLFYNGNSAIVVKRWFHRVDDDASGRTFVEYNPATMGKKGAPPVELLFNSCKLRGVFSAEKFKALVPPALEGAGRTRTRGAAVRELQGVSEVRHLLAQETDDDVRHVCVQAGATTPSK